MLKEVSLSLSALAAIISIFGLGLLWSKKLRPDRRRFRDRPEIFVFLGFWSFVGIHYASVYVYRATTNLTPHDSGYNFNTIGRGAMKMARNSIHQLEEFQKVPFSKPTITMNGKDAGNHIVGQVGWVIFTETYSQFKSEFETTRNSIDLFNVWIASNKNEVCVAEFSTSFDSIKTQIQIMAPGIQSIKENAFTIRDELIIFGRKLIESAETATLPAEYENLIGKKLEMRKGLLQNFELDMASIDEKRPLIISKLKPHTTDKTKWIQNVTFYEIFGSLFTSFLVYLGFGRFEKLMHHKWSARLCSIAASLSAANVLFLATFVLLISRFSCPAEVEKIGLPQLTTEWKPTNSHLAPIRICQPGLLTVFSAFNDTFSLDKDIVASHLMSEFDQIGNGIALLKLDDEKLKNELIEMRKYMLQAKNVIRVNCSEAAASKLTESLDVIEEFLKIGEKLEIKRVELNEKLAGGNANLDSMIDSILMDVQKSMEISIQEIEAKIQSADLSCHSINWKVKSCKNVLCKELDVDLRENWVILDILMVFLVSLFVLDCIVYRTLCLWEIETFGQIQRTPVEQSRVVRRNRPRRLRRLDAHLF